MNIPNLISLGRLFLTPLVVWLIATEQFTAAFWMCWIAGISDIVDGLLARFLGDQTLFGRYLDPIADKILLNATFVTLGVMHFIPLWLVILIVFRDVVILGGALLVVMFHVRFVIEPIFISKINTFVQIGLVLAVLLHAMGYGGAMWVDGFIYGTALTTLLSGLAYVFKWVRQANMTSIPGEVDHER